MRLRLVLLVLLAVCHMGLAQEEEASVTKPCDSEEHRQFDFWVGNWQVEDADGNYAGSNNVVKLLDDCVIQENWEGSSGLRGKSYNVYYANGGYWHQTWVDTSGSLLKLEGGMQDDVMVLEGTTPSTQKPGVTVNHRVTWQLVDDNVDLIKQLWDVSTDAGETWQNIFEGYYHRIK